LNSNDLLIAPKLATDVIEQSDASPLSPLLRGAAFPSRGEGAEAAIQGVVIGELLALSDEGVTPLVRYPGQLGSGAVRARSCIDLHGQHIGSSVVLVFEHCARERPVVVGVLRSQSAWTVENPPAQVEIESDGQRIIVSAREQLVLRCGKASITLTKAGKVLIEGSYVLSRSAGVNRIKGGSVQIN
jgi:hypothetical protein